MSSTFSPAAAGFQEVAHEQNVTNEGWEMMVIPSDPFPHVSSYLINSKFRGCFKTVEDRFRFHEFDAFGR